MNYKSRKLLQNTSIFLLGNIGSKLIQFLLVPLYTYTLTAAQYGETEIVLTAVNLLLPVFSISVFDGLLRYGLDKGIPKDSVVKSSLFIVICGSVLSALCTPLFGLNRTLGERLVYFLLILNLRVYHDFFSVNLKVQDKNKWYAIEGALYTFLLCILSIVFLVVLKMGVTGYYVAYVLSNVLSILFMLMVDNPLKRIRQTPHDMELLRTLVLYSLPMIINGVAWWTTNAADRFMIQWFMTIDDVGIYSVAAKIPSFITTFSGLFNQAWIISAVLEYDEERDMSFYAKTFSNYYSVLFLGTSLLLSVIKPFINIYVGTGFREAWKYAPFLICGASFSCMAAFMVGIYASTRRNTHVTATTLIGAIINVVLNWFLIPQMGIIGAAISTYVSWLIISVIRIYDIRGFFDFYIDYRKIALLAFITLVQGCMVSFGGDIGRFVSPIAILAVLIVEREKMIPLFRSLVKKVL